MSDSELLCNFRSCRRPLHDVAWVTFCSHIFCDVHGKPLTQVPVECPACGAKLAVEIDVQRVNFNPSEHFKSMVLAGLKPSLVFEVCHRALTFWSYQKEQELGYQRHVTSRLRERLQQVEVYYEQVVRNRDDHLARVRRQLQETHVEHDKCREERRATNELLNEKTQQYQKLQILYDTLRKRTGNLRSRSLSPPSNLEVGGQQVSPAPQSTTGLLALTAGGHQTLGASVLPRNSHHHQQTVQDRSEATQQVTSGRPRSAPYHLPVHYSQLPSPLPGHSYHHQRDPGTHRIHVGRYQNPQQGCHNGGNHDPGSKGAHSRELRSFMLRTPRYPSSEDFTFKPALFTDRRDDDQGGSDGPSRGNHPPPV